MAAAYHRFHNGAVLAITKTGLTNPEIRKNMPHGNPAGDGGVVQKFGAKVSTTTSKTSQ